FDVVIEIQDRDRVTVHPDVADTVDAMLRGDPIAPELRWRDEEGIHRSQSRPRPSPREQLGTERFAGLVGAGQPWRVEPGWRGDSAYRTGGHGAGPGYREADRGGFRPGYRPGASGGWRQARAGASREGSARTGPAGLGGEPGTAGTSGGAGGGPDDEGPPGARPDTGPRARGYRGWRGGARFAPPRRGGRVAADAPGAAAGHQPQAPRAIGARAAVAGRHRAGRRRRGRRHDAEVRIPPEDTDAPRGRGAGDADLRPQVEHDAADAREPDVDLRARARPARGRHARDRGGDRHRPAALGAGGALAPERLHPAAPAPDGRAGEPRLAVPRTGAVPAGAPVPGRGAHRLALSAAWA